MAETTYPEPDWPDVPSVDIDCDGDLEDGELQPGDNTGAGADVSGNPDGCSAFSSRVTPYMITGAFVRLIQYHFSDPNNIENEYLKNYIWKCGTGGCNVNVVSGTEIGSTGEVVSDNADLDGSRILITVSYDQSEKAVQQRPAIFIKREVVETQKISLRDKSIDGLNNKGIFNGSKHQLNITGSHSFIAVGGSGSEAELLAEDIMFRMIHYKPLLLEELKLGMIHIASMSDVRELGEESSKAFYVVVSVRWAYVYRWQLIPEAPLIKRLSLNYTEE